MKHINIIAGILILIDFCNFIYTHIHVCVYIYVYKNY